MKKIISLSLILMFMLLFSGCSDNGQEQKKAEFNFDTKSAVYNGEDGWLYFFYCEYNKGENTPYSYNFDAYNLKHKKIEGYIISITDDSNNQVGTMEPSLPYLLLNTDYTDDFESINHFFEEKSPTDELSGEDCEELILEKIDKDLVVNLYNEAVTSDVLADGKYAFLPEADIVQGKGLNGYFWQVGFFISHGNIKSVDIELMDSDGNYLSDGTISNLEEGVAAEVSSRIEDIEKQIMEQQTFRIDGDSLDGDFGSIDFQQLQTLLESVENGSYEK